MTRNWPILSSLLNCSSSDWKCRSHSAWFTFAGIRKRFNAAVARLQAVLVSPAESNCAKNATLRFGINFWSSFPLPSHCLDQPYRFAQRQCPRNRPLILGIIQSALRIKHRQKIFQPGLMAILRKIQRACSAIWRCASMLDRIRPELNNGNYNCGCKLKKFPPPKPNPVMAVDCRPINPVNKIFRYKSVCACWTRSSEAWNFASAARTSGRRFNRSDGIPSFN